MSRLPPAVAALALMLTASPAAAADVVVWLPLAGEAVDRGVKTRLDTELRAALAALPNVSVPSAKVVDESVAGANALGGACRQQEIGCMVRIASLAGANLVATGTLSRAAGGVEVSLRLVDVGRAAERATTRLAISGTTPDALTRAARLLAVRLVRPEREVGVVVVRVAQAGATVSVGDQVKGTTPLAAPIELKPGKYVLYVSHPRHETVAQPFEVEFGGTATFDLDLARPGATVRAEGIVENPGPAAPAGTPDGPPQSRPSRPSMLVFGIEVAGVDPAWARSVEEIAAAAAADAGAKVFTRADMKQMAELGAQQQAMNCAGDACMAEIAAALGADLVLYGNVTEPDGVRTLALMLHDTRTNEIERTVLFVRGGDLQAQVAPAVTTLLKKQRPGLVPAAAGDRALSSSSPVLPVATVVTGGVLLAAGVVVTAVAEVLASDKAAPGDDREILQTIGRVGLVGAAAGVVAIGAGAALWLWSTE